MSMPTTSIASVPSAVQSPPRTDGAAHAAASAPAASARPADAASPRSAAPFRTRLAEKIFLDRYALKSADKAGLRVGDTVVYCPNPHESEKKRRREIGTIVSIDVARREAEVRLRDDPADVPVRITLDHVDRPMELDWDALSHRVARAIAAVEPTPEARTRAEGRFEHALRTRAFVPGGRILAGAGAPGDLTFYNCFVIPSPKDSRKGILETAGHQFEIMSRGGGVGINVSSLRPQYDSVIGVNGRSSGAVSWADLYSFITGKVEQGGSRRGALMIIMDVWHPDILAFVRSKHQIGVLDNANISVGIPDAFMAAVDADASWDLVFPDRRDPDYDAIWDGDLDRWKAAGKRVNVYRTIRARELYQEICKSAWASAEPGLFFTDRVNRLSNSHYYQPIRCTNPCGEQPLPPWGVCNLGALNLGEFVRPTPNGERFWPALDDDASAGAKAGVFERVDLEKLAEMTRTGVHFLDDVIDATTYFIDEIAAQQRAERRVGLGVMGLAELLVRAGVRYGSEVSNALTDRVFAVIRDASYAESIELARTKGSFERFDADRYLAGAYAQQLPEALRAGIREHGIRNVTLLTVAPTGTTGTMMATSTGIEPYFMFRFERRGRLGNHVVEEAVVTDYRDTFGLVESAELPPQFRTTEDLLPLDHVQIMAIAQRYVDSAISKTCNLPTEFTVEDVETFYRKLYELGCKGGTVYRDQSRQEQVLVKLPESAPNAEPKPVPAASASAPAPAQQPAAARKRADPVKHLPAEPRLGFTHAMPTPIGRVHVTLNLDPIDHSPFDVFITLSKAGSDTDADTDALGRLISLLLRLNVDIPSRTRLELAIEQIRGIATSRAVGFGPDRIRSVPDGIGHCLEQILEHVEHLKTSTGPSLIAPPRGDAPPARSSAAKPRTAAGGNGSAPAKTSGAFMHVCPDCGNATAANVDGCFKCFACGYSEC